ILYGDTSGFNPEDHCKDVKKALRSLYNCPPTFFPDKNRFEILAELKKGYAVCHFIGHGQYKEDEPDESGLLCSGGILSWRDLEKAAGATFPYLIFANACESARPPLQSALPSLGSERSLGALHSALLSCGIPNFIGTIAQVPA